jgi:hypothetical protein
MKNVFKMLILLFLLFPTFGLSEVKEIIAEGTYNMGDGETPTDAESSVFSETVLTRFTSSFPFCERSERQQKSKHPAVAQFPLHKKMGASWGIKNRAYIFVPVSNAY